MHVRSTAVGLEIQAPAKLNLFLTVIGKRDDGFHEIETLMYPVAMFDTLTFAPSDSRDLTFSCRAIREVARDAEHPDALPTGSDNLVLKALELLRGRLGVKAGAQVHLTKRIPLAAGLAGGSSDAAAAIVAANRGWGLGLTHHQMASYAAELGSDVPFFLGQGPAICRGRGEQIEPVGGLGCLPLVIVRPPEGLATAAVYKACRPEPTSRPVGDLLAALRAGAWRLAGARFHNTLQSAAETLSPWINRLKREFEQMDCWGHGMSGSGTSYFGLCRHFRHAQRLANRLRSRGLGQVFAVQGSC